MKIIYERLLAEVLEARLERLGWIAARRSSSAAKKPSILVDTLNAKDRRQKLLLERSYTNLKKYLTSPNNICTFDRVRLSSN